MKNGQTWYPGKTDDKNLGGTIRTLDGIHTITLHCSDIDPKVARDHYLYCAYGIPSRNGWGVIYDSTSTVLQSNGYWVNGTSPSNSNDQDFYLFMFGTNYKQALKDYSLIGGSIPLVPRYMLGTYFTRWYGYDFHTAQMFLNRWREKGLPMDVLILDMNWHVYGRWGGYSWDT
eukprot:UN28906